MRAWVLLLVGAGCAAGPRPVPQGVTAAERLAFSEAATLAAKAVATFQIDSQGAHTSHFTGTLELTGTNALTLVAEGTFDQQPVRLEFDSMKGDIDRTVTKGAVASAQHNLAQPALNEAVVIGLVRRGLLHSLAMLVADQMVSKAAGGVREELQALDPRDGGPDTSGGEACHRVDSTLQVGGQSMARTSLCVADATGLPLQRSITVQFPDGQMTATERFTWKMK